MNMIKKTLLTSILLWVMTAMTVFAQLKGEVVDAITGECIPMAGVVYRSHNVMVAADIQGKFSIQRHNGWTLFITAVGYKTQQFVVSAKTPSYLVIKMKPDTKQLNEVVVKSKKNKYSRDNNPAVELMRRVIAKKKDTRLENNNFYQYYKYQKMTLAKNDITIEDLAEMKSDNKKEWMSDQVELCPMNNKLIMPIHVTETVTHQFYRKNPENKKAIVEGQTSNGVMNLMETAGSIVETVMKDVFTDVNIYDDQVRLVQFPFTSPIGKDAINFYRYYITDTVMIDKDQCIELNFTPNNPQDFGFRGVLWVLNDESLHVRKVSLTLPQKTDVNFLQNLKIEQEYEKLPDGQWVLATDNMLAEIYVNRMLKNAVVIRSTKNSEYAFNELPKNVFKGGASTIVRYDSKTKDEKFWTNFRTVELTKSESSMNKFVQSIRHLKGINYLLIGLQALIDDYVETNSSDSTKSKFDIGPLKSTINHNIVDGYRVRIGGQTTAALNPHLFLSGYVAHGFDPHNWYYSSRLTYAFNKKDNQPWEFPIREVSFLSEKDITSPSELFLETNKDNIFTAFHVKDIKKFYFYNRQQVQFKYEWQSGFSTTFYVKAEKLSGTGDPVEGMKFYDMQGNFIESIRNTQFGLTLRYAPGETLINTKKRRYPINLDAPVFTLNHRMGVKNLFGGGYTTNYTEASIFKRIWFNSWGKFDIYAAAGAQWNKVPFPLLIMPQTNLSWISMHGTHTFQLMNDLEFLNDRFAMWHLSWDLNGKILNRIPLVKKLKWREYISFRGMFGHLTNKNNPFLEQNANDDVLMRFPEGSHVMTGRPYMELLIGVHNILKLFEVDYVRRLSYTEHGEGMMLNGVRFGINLTF